MITFGSQYRRITLLTVLFPVVISFSDSTIYKVIKKW